MIQLTASQVEALKLLAEKPRETTKTTHHGYISGQCAQALMRRGLATGDYSSYPIVVSITDEGRDALVAHRKKP